MPDPKKRGYKQTPGSREKNSPGSFREDSYVNVKFQPEGDNPSYDISVKEGSPYHKHAQKYGSVQGSLRNIHGVTKSTDPYTAGISKEEKKRRMSKFE